MRRRVALVVALALAGCESEVPAVAEPRPTAPEPETPRPPAPGAVERDSWEPAGVAEVELLPVDLSSSARLMRAPAQLQSPQPPPKELVPTNCVPATCSDLLATCGTVSDGCGGTLACGTCAAPSVCGVARPNACGNPGRYFTQLALGRSTTCAVAQDHALFCWGAGRTASPTQLGTDTDWASVATAFNTCGIKLDGTLWCFAPASSTPQRVGTESDWTAISGTGATLCALRANGTLWCWGQLLAQPMTIPWSGPSSATPVQVEPPSTWRSISVGGEEMCAISTTGALWCWAHHTYADRGGVYWYSPRVQLRAPGDWRKASSACGIRVDGELWCWSAQQLDGAAQGATIGARMQPGQSWSDVTSGGRGFCAIRADGTLWCWDGPDPSLGWLTGSMARGRIDDRTDWVSVSGGGGHFCGARLDHSTYCWGWNSQGALGIGITPQPLVAHARVSPTMLFASVGMTYSIRSDGTLWGAGLGQPQMIDGDTQWQHLHPPFAIKNDGSLWWLTHRDATPRAADGLGWRRVGAAPDGWWFGVKRDGTLWRWRFQTATCCAHDPVPGTATRVGSETTWVDVAASWSSVCGLRADGSVSCGLGGTQTDIAGHWRSVCGAGRGGICGLTGAGQLQCWDGALSGVTLAQAGIELGCGDDAVCVIGTDRSLWCAGADGARLGAGQTARLSQPVRIGAANDWRSISIIGNQSCGLRGNGAMFCSGSYFAGDGSGHRDVPAQLVP